MKITTVFTLLCVVPSLAFGAVRADSTSRVGVTRGGSVSRMPTMSAVISPTVSTSAGTGGTTVDTPVVDSGSVDNGSSGDTGNDGSNNGGNNGGGDSVTGGPVFTGDCRADYRQCMDEFCLLEESEGFRCACSSNINKSKSLIKEIQSIQEEADKLYTEGVEREHLGAKARYIFGESEKAKRSSAASGISFLEWINGTGEEEEDSDGVGADADIGDGLYSMAAEYCAPYLESCGGRAEMEEMLYSRMVVADCKSFGTYLAEQKINANANKRTAEAAVRQARLEEFSTTNKYNRGECLLAYRGCIADKGGCGTNFENCLDADLLGRRAYACENILDQCLASREYVLQDWEDESVSILENAAKYADRYARQTCLARIQVCLEDGCSTGTNPACLTDVNVAAGVCPVITECEEMIPGIQATVNDKLGYLRTQFCQNDIDKCLQDKCGENFNAPECVGKKASDILELCPQSMFPSCKNAEQYEVIVSAVLLQMDYQMMQGCVNYFGEQLGRVCGTDMSCLPMDSTVASLQELPEKESEFAALRATVRANASAAVDEFFKQFEKDTTVAACQDTEKPIKSGRKSLGNSVFTTAKMIAEIGAENRALRELEKKIAEMSREKDLEEARQACLNTYKVETPEEGKKNYSYIRSVSFEPSLRNCHVCRMQQVCETGGESKNAAGLKAAAGGLSAGAAAGTMVTPGWGTAIGSAVGAIGGFFAGRSAGGEKEFCQEIESCEDVNM